jgi:hypothetical protein
MTIPQHPFRSQWQPIKVDVVGYRIVDTIDAAALEAVYLFCNQHPREVVGQPIGLFPTTDPNDPEWNLRVVPESHRLEGSVEETLQGTIRFMNVQHHYQLLLRRGMGQLTSIAQGHFQNAFRQVTQIEQLQALVIEKDAIIAAREETILHNATRSLSFSRNKSMTSSLRLMMPMLKSMNSNSSQYLLLYQHPKPKKKIQRKLKEFQTSIPSTEILFLVPIIPLRVANHPWATLMTFSFI